MLISLDYLIEKYKIKFTGILHVGMHEAEEIEIYEKYIIAQAGKSLGDFFLMKN